MIINLSSGRLKNGNIHFSKATAVKKIYWKLHRKMALGAVSEKRKITLKMLIIIIKLICHSSGGQLGLKC